MYAKRSKLAGFAVGVVIGSTALTASQPKAETGPASAPVVVSEPTSSAPTPPAGENLFCPTGPDSPSPDGPGSTCPVVKADGAPVVVSEPTSSAPTPPAGADVRCFTGPNSPSPDGFSSTCPVIQVDGLTLWPFSYDDNRGAIDVVGYDSTGAMVSQQQVNGPRYIWQVTVDANTKTVVFWGQSKAQGSLPWSALPPLPPLTFWPFSYNDNSFSTAVVGYDSKGAMVSQQQVNGPRYIWRVTVDANTQTVGFWGQSPPQASLPWSAFPPPPPPAPVVVSEPTSSAPNPPAGENLFCPTGPNSPSPDGASSTCSVVKAGGRAYWPFSYNDNSFATAVVGYDSTGAMVSQQQVNGPRYIWQVTVDANTKTVVFWGQGNAQGSLPWSAFPPPPPPAPVVVSEPTSSAPNPPAGENLFCPTGPNSPSPDGASSTCPVVQVDGRSFWPFNYNDNPGAVDVVGYDSSGAKVSQQQLNGVRSIWHVTVDANMQTVGFWGQSTPQASLPWSAFAPH